MSGPPRRAAAAMVAFLAASPLGLDAQDRKTVTSSRMVTDEVGLDVHVSYGAGALTLRAGEPDILYHTVFRFREGRAAPYTEYQDGTLRVALEKGTRRGIGVGSGEASLDLELSPEVPMEITLDFGAGHADLDLTALPIRDLTINTGASESILHVDERNPESMESARIHVGAADLRIHGMGNLNTRDVTVQVGMGSVVLGLDGAWPTGAHIDVDVGLGSLDILVPHTLGVRVHHRSSFLASLDLDQFVRDGDVYHSVNWDRADRKVDIDLEATLGSVELIWVR